MYLPVFAVLHEELVLAKSLYSSGDIGGASVHLDKARNLRSKISRQQRLMRQFSLDEWDSQLDLTQSPSTKYLPIAQSCNQLWNDISKWLRTVVGQVEHNELLHSNIGLNLLLDEKLPAVWDFNHDIIVLWGAEAELLVAPLVDRGQAQIIVITDGNTEGKAPVWNPSPEATVLHVDRSEPLTADQTDALKRVEPPLIHGISFEVHEQPIEELKNLARQVQNNHVAGASDRRWPTIHTEQLIENLPLFIGKESVCSISTAFHGKDILIVSPAPSLRDSLPNLKRFREKFVVISLARSLQVLFDYELIPDFAIMVDSQDHSNVGGINLIPANSVLSEVPLIVSEYTHSSTFKYDFKNFYLLPTRDLIGSPLSIAIHGEYPPAVSGFGVAISAVTMAAELGARSITIVGQDLSLARGSYADDEQAVAQHADIDYLKCTGINGAKLPTKSDYLLFISEFEALAKVYGDNIAMFNSTSFGAYLEGWRHIILDENHPVVSSNWKEIPVREGSVREVSQGIVKAVTGSLLKQALREEIRQLKMVQHLASKILEELDSLLRSGSNDVSILEKLEHKLLAQMTTNGSLITFYSTHAKLATDTSLESVENLTENFMVSSDYYGFIAAGANRLIKRLSDVPLES